MNRQDGNVLSRRVRQAVSAGFATLVLVTVAGASTPPAAPPAAGGATASRGGHDLVGIYNLMSTFQFPGAPKPDPSLADLKPYHPDHGGEATAHLVPWALEKMKASSEYSAADDTGAVCQLAGFFRHPTTVAGYMVLQEPGKVLLVSMDLDQVGVRRIYLTDHHPANLRPSWDGNSIGHWEGDTLVVDTVGFNDKSWLGSELQPHSEELHVVERIHLVKDGRALEIYTTIDDRKALTGPYSYSRYYARTTQSWEDTRESCNPNLGDQATWDYQRRQAILQLQKNRAAAQASAAAAAGKREVAPAAAPGAPPSGGPPAADAK